ncbi:Zinc transporter ZIP9 [Camponotus floridanus]|uniref:Zinc transporter ZIP9 n=1 Tax=Camponotus floridanus TaxID=104421 RepID=E2AQ27_CAMFO|nr:Zinc transporter ZIP9 [Camponotus floridanus]
MEERAMLWMLSLVMFVGSCVAGSLPLVINLSEDKLQLVSILGAGLLVGTALAVIIPEGNLHSLIGISLVLGFVFMLLIDQCSARKSGGRQKSITATLGLIVHAAVDGVALGAAATTSQADVEVIVFFAIMLHKEGKETLSSVNATGLAMLFSAGTFLYVATVHVLPELMTRSSNYSHLSNEGTTSSGLKVKEILFLVIGSFLPALITIHHH